MNADELTLISVDDHICEPADMFEGRVPAKYREYVPVSSRPRPPNNGGTATCEDATSV